MMFNIMLKIKRIFNLFKYIKFINTQVGLMIVKQYVANYWNLELLKVQKDHLKFGALDVTSRTGHKKKGCH